MSELIGNRRMAPLHRVKGEREVRSDGRVSVQTRYDAEVDPEVIRAQEEAREARIRAHAERVQAELQRLEEGQRQYFKRETIKCCSRCPLMSILPVTGLRESGWKQRGKRKVWVCSACLKSQ